MADHRGSCTGAALMALALIGCSGGDLTLPGGPTPSAPEQPAALEVLSGDGQRADAGTILEDPLTVQVLGDSSQPMSNVRVQFSFLGDLSGAALEPSSTLTDDEGRAEAIVRLGALPGEQVIVATVSELPDLRAQFSVTALVPDDDDDDGKNGGKGKDDDD